MSDEEKFVVVVKAGYNGWICIQLQLGGVHSISHVGRCSILLMNVTYVECQRIIFHKWPVVVMRSVFKLPYLCELWTGLYNSSRVDIGITCVYHICISGWRHSIRFLLVSIFISCIVFITLGGWIVLLIFKYHRFLIDCVYNACWLNRTLNL